MSQQTIYLPSWAHRELWDHESDSGVKLDSATFHRLTENDIQINMESNARSRNLFDEPLAVYFVHEDDERLKEFEDTHVVVDDRASETISVYDTMSEAMFFFSELTEGLIDEEDETDDFRADGIRYCMGNRVLSLASGKALLKRLDYEKTLKVDREKALKE